MKANETQMPKHAILAKLDQICVILDGKIRNNPNDEGYNRLMDMLEKYLHKLSMVE
jgi:hypothetical protein